MGSRIAIAVLVFAAACGGDGQPAFYPPDYAATFQEVRDCRFSLEHDLVRIRVLASPDAVAAYMSRSEPFPTGAMFVKEQFHDSDTTCNGPLVEVTAMRKLEVGSSPDTLDWEWEKAGADHDVLETDLKRCTRCHQMCGEPPEGYDGTCAMP